MGSVKVLAHGAWKGRLGIGAMSFLIPEAAFTPAPFGTLNPRRLPTLTWRRRFSRGRVSLIRHPKAPLQSGSMQRQTNGGIDPPLASHAREHPSARRIAR